MPRTPSKAAKQRVVKSRTARKKKTPSKSIKSPKRPKRKTERV